MRISRGLIIAALVAASTAGVLVAQQGGVVLPNGGWVPCDHPAAAGRCGSPTQAPIVPADTPPPTGAACDYVSPYTDRPACVVGDYRIGHIYPFGTVNRGLVIGLSMASDGAEVVTVQWVYDLPDAPRQVWAFINDGVTPRPWEWRR